MRAPALQLHRTHRTRPSCVFVCVCVAHAFKNFERTSNTEKRPSHELFECVCLCKGNLQVFTHTRQPAHTHNTHSLRLCMDDTPGTLSSHVDGWMDAGNDMITLNRSIVRAVSRLLLRPAHGLICETPTPTPACGRCVRFLSRDVGTSDWVRVPGPTNTLGPIVCEHTKHVCARTHTHTRLLALPLER